MPIWEISITSTNKDQPCTNKSESSTKATKIQPIFSEAGNAITILNPDQSLSKPIKPKNRSLIAASKSMKTYKMEPNAKNRMLPSRLEICSCWVTMICPSSSAIVLWPSRNTTIYISAIQRMKKKQNQTTHFLPQSSTLCNFWRFKTISSSNETHLISEQPCKFISTYKKQLIDL